LATREMDQIENFLKECDITLIALILIFLILIILFKLRYNQSKLAKKGNFEYLKKKLSF
jgi:uncharacterized membrane protein affecting hemolysin expression